ncbi:hydrogenase maturation nickel metallochaperone HypA [Archaeoglobus sp.]
MSFAQAILDTVMKVAEQKNAKKINAVHVAVGNLLMLNPEQLKFCFDVITKGTIAENAKLEVEVVKAKIKCTSCGKEFEEYIGICDECGGILSVEGGKEMILKRVEMEV